MEVLNNDMIEKWFTNFLALEKVNNVSFEYFFGTSKVESFFKQKKCRENYSV